MKNIETILNTLGEAIDNKDRQIVVLNWQIETLQKKLAEAEEAAKEAQAQLDGTLCRTRIMEGKEV